MSSHTKRESFTDAELEELRAQYARVETVDPETTLPRFRKIFAGCQDKALKQLARANIKFVSLLAVNACTRRGLSTNDGNDECLEDTGRDNWKLEPFD